MSRRQATLLFNAQVAGATTNTIYQAFDTAGYDNLLFLANLSAISAGSAEFRMKALGNYYNLDTYKTTLSATGFVTQGIGPGCETAIPLLPSMWIEVDVTTGPVTYTVEVWGY